MNITSRQLKAFVLTARHQSFSRAAEQLFITQSGMSVLVRELETQLGFRLFERTTRKVELTRLGAQFLPVADRNLRELEAVAANLSRSAAAANDTLSIGAAPFPAAEIMPQAISAYMALNPRLQIQMIDAERARLIEMLNSGKIDVALLTGLREELPGMRQTPLARFALMLICPADGLHELPLELRWSDIAGLRLIGLPRDAPVQQLVDEQLVRAGRAGSADVTCNFLETQIAMVEAGAGAAVTPTSAAPACVKRKLTMHALVDPVVWTEFCWVSSRSRELSPCAEDFGEFLRFYLTHIADQGPSAAARAA
jgi:LysR family transcriptional regulator, carnitine catabolism transcriptional activator